MKYITITIVSLILTLAVQAQGGMRQRTVEERVALVHEKTDATFKFEAAKQAKIDSAFATYYRGQDKLREEMRNNSNGERPDMGAMREKMKPLTDARDKELQTIMTEDEFKKWKEKVEPELMPRRNGGGPGGQNRQ